MLHCIMICDNNFLVGTKNNILWKYNKIRHVLVIKNIIMVKQQQRAVVKIR